MSDISVTAASVIASSGAVRGSGTAGASITALQTLYIDTSDSNKLKLADANAASPAYIVEGLSLHAALAGQPIQYIKSGQVTLNAVLTTGLVYVNSATAGGIAPSADLTTGWRTSTLGIALSTTVLDVRIHNSEIAV